MFGDDGEGEIGALLDRLAGDHGLCRQQASFDRRHLLQALAEAHPEGASLDRLNTLAARLVSRPGIVPSPTDDRRPDPRWTTAGAPGHRGRSPGQGQGSALVLDGRWPIPPR